MNEITMEALRAAVRKTMRQNDINEATFAGEIGFAGSTVNLWLSGKRNTDSVAEAADRWLRTMSPAAVPLTPGFIELKNTLNVWELCDQAIRTRRIVLIVGRPGLGKTYALEEYCRRAMTRDRNLVYQVVNPSTRRGTMAKVLARKFELNESGCAFDVLERVLYRLTEYPVPVILDECNHLNVDCLEQLRYLWDMSRVPIVLAGSRRLMRTLSHASERNFELEQLQSRIAWQLELKPLTRAEIGRCVTDRMGDQHEQIVAEFEHGSRGITRDLFNGIEQVQELMEINCKLEPTVELVRYAFKHRLLGPVSR